MKTRILQLSLRVIPAFALFAFVVAMLHYMGKQNGFCFCLAMFGAVSGNILGFDKLRSLYWYVIPSGYVFFVSVNWFGAYHYYFYDNFVVLVSYLASFIAIFTTFCLASATQIEMTSTKLKSEQVK